MEDVLRFGKHKGKRLRDVSAAYLDWLLKSVDLQPPLANAVKLELGRRGKRFVDAAEVLEELEQLLEQRIADDPAIDHQDAGAVNDAVMLAFADIRAKYGIREEPQRGPHQ